MSDFIEAVVTLLPVQAGGRPGPVWPRHGSYRPYARLRSGGALMRIRFIEGPPRLAPGDTDRVVLEIESASRTEPLVIGAELDLLERGATVVGLALVDRFWRDAPAFLPL